MENRRTESAREHDDNALIDSQTAGGGESGRSGGKLALDVSTEDELDEIGDPDGRTRVTKKDDIAHGMERRPEHPRGV